jgi:hypothetical protein
MPTPTPEPVPTLPIYGLFSRLYAAMPVNSPSKRKALVRLMQEYANLPYAQKKEFEQYVLMRGGQ